MKNLFIGGLAAMVTLSVNVPTLAASEVQIETYATTVTAGRCVNMKRDTKYSTPSWKTSSGSGFVKVKNCEDDATADGYNGYADMYIEAALTGKNVLERNDVYIYKGKTKKYSHSQLINGYNYVSSVDWEIIDGQNYAGSKKIYSYVI